MTRRKRIRNRPPPELCTVVETSYEHTPGADTDVFVEIEYEQKFTGIYTTRTKIGETRTPIPHSGQFEVNLSEDEQLDLKIVLSRLDAALIVDKRLTVLINDTGGVWLDLVTVHTPARSDGAG